MSDQMYNYTLADCISLVVYVAAYSREYTKLLHYMFCPDHVLVWTSSCIHFPLLLHLSYFSPGSLHVALNLEISP